MTRRNSIASGQRVGRQLAELALAAPQVVAHRTARMASAGLSPSKRDRAEFARMGAEKVAAFHESWWAMWTACWALPVRFAMSLSPPGATLAAAASNAALLVAASGLAPIHRRAVSNARRLSGRRRK